MNWYEEARNVVNASNLPNRVLWYLNEYWDEKDAVIEAFTEAVRGHLQDMKAEMEEDY